MKYHISDKELVPRLYSPKNDELIIKTIQFGKKKALE